MEKADAISMLEGLGFVVNILPDETAAGKVKTQLPAGGTYLNYGSSIAIEIDILRAQLKQQSNQQLKHQQLPHSTTTSGTT